MGRGGREERGEGEQLIERGLSLGGDSSSQNKLFLLKLEPRA